MFKAFWRIIIDTILMIWQILLFLWVGLHAFGEWLHDVIHDIFKANGFIGKLAIFVAAMLFCPYPWWVAFLLVFVPAPVAVPVLVVFFIMFVASFAQSIVFI
jgi:hypothetical protein